jgi:hypothetical protein
MEVKAMRTNRYFFLILLVSLYASPADAMFVGPTYAPVNRLIANTTAFVKENPGNAHGYYTLARIHYLAFINKASVVGVTNEDSPPRIAPDWLLGDFVFRMRWERALELTLAQYGYSSRSDIPKKERRKFNKDVQKKEQQLEKEGWRFERLKDEECVNHAAKAMRNFRKAISLDQDNGLYHLGLASLLQQYVQFLRDIELDQVPEEFRSIILSRAKELYYTAYKLSIKDDLKKKYMPLEGLRGLVGYEGGKAYVRLVKDDKSITDSEKKKLSKVEKDLKRLGDLPVSMVTPIIFSFEKCSALPDLLAPGLRVRFNLDGDGDVELWPWVKPTTGILVWDPDGKGLISSGRQLFGSVSWWLFFADGYHALDALDDDRNGALSGPELAGISVWFDRDCDGKSDLGEVVRLENLSILSIATRSTGKDHGCPMNISGVKLMDGRTFPTYDWITSPVGSAP